MRWPHFGGVWSAKVAVTCRVCGLSLKPRFALLAPEWCPRCLARRQRLVRLEGGSSDGEGVGGGLMYGTVETAGRPVRPSGVGA